MARPVHTPRIALEASALLALSAAFGGMIAAAQRLGFARAFGIDAGSLGVELQSLLLLSAVGIVILFWGIALVALTGASLFSAKRGNSYAIGCGLLTAFGLLFLYWTRKLRNAEGDVQQFLLWTVSLAALSAVLALASRMFYVFHSEISTVGWQRIAIIALIGTCLVVILALPIHSSHQRLEVATYFGATLWIGLLLSYMHPNVRNAFKPRKFIERALGRFGAFSSLTVILSTVAAWGFIFRRPQFDDHTLLVTLLILSMFLLSLRLVRSFRKGKRWLYRTLPIPSIALIAVGTTFSMASGAYSYHSGYSAGIYAQGTANRSIDTAPTLSEYVFGRRYFWVCPEAVASGASIFQRSLFLAQNGEAYVVWSQSTGVLYLPVGAFVLKQNC